MRDVRDTVTSHVPFAPLTHKQHSLISAYPWPTNWDKFNVQWVASTLSNWVDKIGNERLTKTTQKGSGGTYRSMGPPPGSWMSGWFICSVELWFFLSIRKIYEAFSIGEASNNQKFTLSMMCNQRALSTRLVRYIISTLHIRRGDSRVALLLIVFIASLNLIEKQCAQI